MKSYKILRAPEGEESILGGGSAVAEPAAEPAAEPVIEAPAAPAAPAGKDAGTTESWFKGLYGEDGKIEKSAWDRLPEHLKPAAETLKRYDSMEDLMGTIWHQKQALSKGGLTRPDADAPDEIKAQFNEKLAELTGAPKSSAEYDFSTPEDMPDHLKWDDGEASEVKDILHKYNAPPEMAMEIRDFYVKLKSADEAQGLELFKSQEKAALDALGGEKDLITKNALESMSVLGFTTEQAHILANAAVGAGIGADVLRGIAGLKNLISDDKFVNPASQGGVMATDGTSYSQKANDALSAYYTAKDSNDVAGMERAKAQENEYRRLALKAGEPQQ